MNTKRILVPVVILVLVYVVLSVIIAFPFSNVLFKPPARPGGVPSLTESDAQALREHWTRDDSVQVDVLTVPSAAGPKPIELSAWWVFRDSSRGKPTVVFLAGNGGLGAANFEDEVQLLTSMGFNCLLLDQRGYGASMGELLTHGWFERGDFAAVIDTLTNRYGADPGRVGIWGISMGASNAVDIAAARPETKAILLFAPWSTPQVMAVNYIGRTYPVPRFLLRFPAWAAIQVGTHRYHGHILDPAVEAAKVRCHAAVVSGDADDITAPELTDKLFQALAGEKERVVVPGAHHNDLLSTMGQPRYLELLKTFFAPLLSN
jgi:pimeloyl-ACP methyl ester carboxylesterase